MAPASLWDPSNNMIREDPHAKKWTGEYRNSSGNDFIGKRSFTNHVDDFMEIFPHLPPLPCQSTKFLNGP